MSKYTYTLELKKEDGEWVEKTPLLRHCGLKYLTGYMSGVQDCRMGPCPAMRVVRSDGKVMEELEERREAHIGMIAGFITPDQYRDAAKRAFEKALSLKKRELEKHLHETSKDQKREGSN